MTLIAPERMIARRALSRTRQIDHVCDRDQFPDVVTWIQTQFYIPELNGPMQLAPYQQAVMNEACRLDVAGNFVYDLVLWSDIKKSIKSCIAAAVVLYRALHTEWFSAKIVANDLKQADSRVFFYIRRCLELNTALGERATIRNYKITFDNHSVIEAIPVDPSGEAGGNDDLLEYTELHAFNSKAALRLWTETTISPTKYGKSQRWADTYAGMSGESPILEPLYERLVKPENQLDLGIPGLEVYANGKQLSLWNTQPRLSWQTPDYYASESATILPNEFLRVHRNQWTTSVNVFVPPEWWDGCKQTLPEFDAKDPVIVGVDAAVSGDCFAIVAVTRKADTVYVRSCRIWTPPKGGALDYGAENGPDQYLRELARTFNVIQFAYDPYQLHDLATRGRKDGVGWFREFPQGQDRLIADKQLYDTIRDRRLVHDGNVNLTEHVKNANAKLEGDNKLRIVKRAEHLKIDACVALSMASSEARRLLVG